MKAIYCTAYGQPDVLEMREVERPIPKANEVLIKTHATSATVADFRMRSFKVPLALWLPARLAVGLRKPRKPILGVELAGVIEAVGEDVTLWKAGDEVFASSLKDFGGYAEYKCLPENWQMAYKPKNLTFEEAATIPIGGRTALHFLRKANIQKGHKVLVYGASGSVGTYTVQIARYFGAEVTAVCSAQNFELVRSLGASHTIDYTEGDFTRKLEKYDIIFLAIDKWPFSSCKKFLKDKGVYVNVTFPFKSLNMLWTSLSTKKRSIMAHNPPDSAEDLSFLKDLAEKGELKPIIDSIYPLEQIGEAHKKVEAGHKKGNIAITVHS